MYPSPELSETIEIKVVPDLSPKASCVELEEDRRKELVKDRKNMRQSEETQRLKATRMTSASFVLIVQGEQTDARTNMQKNWKDGRMIFL